jgi:hypothetical protein
MLVTFETNSYAKITMFGDVARRLIRLMGRNDKVPGVLLSEDVPDALARLRSGLEQIEEPASEDDGADQVPPVSLAHRALPVIELLEVAERDRNNVMWNIK